ncbi:type I-E CRISPR-associated endoribonuclease Cas2e [Thalassospira xianhensis]|uniref:CRISPR-associated protein Cas2 n=1 Tax=Thalassospira xianhensis MCCC 1A02616 TaxID=1177929 RepID=A0A367UDC8_9PROT|nr:CRISPR-associated protein Cas2 [Thalassospira xianhensis MCCC 1A02616]
MITIVVRTLEPRFHGFLSSIMLEVSQGVFVQPSMSSSIRDTVWQTLADWYEETRNGSILMFWPSRKQNGKLMIRTLGEPSREVVDFDGLLLIKK